MGLTLELIFDPLDGLYNGCGLDKSQVATRTQIDILLSVGCIRWNNR